MVDGNVAQHSRYYLGALSACEQEAVHVGECDARYSVKHLGCLRCEYVGVWWWGQAENTVAEVKDSSWTVGFGVG